MSVCTKFQLSSWSRSGWTVCGSGGGGGGGVGGEMEHAATMSNLNPRLEVRVALSWVELGLGFDNIFYISIIMIVISNVVVRKRNINIFQTYIFYFQ